MMNVTALVPLAEKNVASNRERFIELARDQVAAFGHHLDFDRLDWDVSGYCPTPAGKGKRKAVLYFATHDNGTAKSAADRTPLPEPFGSVIKAIVRLKKDGNAKLSSDPLNRIINASRYLTPLLADRGYDPCRIIPRDLDEACDAIVARGGEATTHYRLGQALEAIVETLARYNILAFSFTWKNPFPRITNQSRIGKRAEENRGKIVEEDVLEELARLSHLVVEDSDRMLMAAIKLLHCAPWRIGEVNTIPYDCWVERVKIGPDGPVFDGEGRPIIRCGIRYWPEKSTDADIKWLPDVMVPVARAAIETLLEISAPARELARWYECNIGRAWLPGRDGGLHQPFTLDEISEMFGLSGRSGARQWLATRKVPIANTAPQTARRRDIEGALISHWNKLAYLTEDRRGLKRSQHLFLTSANLHNYRGTNPCIISMTTDQHIRDFLSGRGNPVEKRVNKRQGQVLSVFERFGSKTSDGRPMRVNSHQFRHWLNDLAQRGSMTQMLIARWSGRKEIQQNAEYDHMSGVELAEKGRQLLDGGQVIGLLADVHDRLDPVERERFRENVFATAHVTDLGVCDHNFFSAPCPELSDEACGSCENLNVKKGDRSARERAQRNRDDTEWLLERAFEEMEDGAEGASNFVEAHTMRLAGLDRIIMIHDDPKIPDGTWVRSTNESPAQFEGPRLRGLE